MENLKKVSALVKNILAHDHKARTVSYTHLDVYKRQAQALLNDPKIIILDEPTAGLDPKERVRFRNLIKDLGKDSIVLLSTHIDVYKRQDENGAADDEQSPEESCQCPK